MRPVLLRRQAANHATVRLQEPTNRTGRIFIAAKRSFRGSGYSGSRIRRRAERQLGQPLVRLRQPCFDLVQACGRQCHLGESCRSDIFPPSHHSIAECRLPRRCLGTHLKSSPRAVGYEQPVVVIVLRDENVIGVGVYSRGKVGVELDLSPSVGQFAGPEVLEPVLRALQAIEPPMRSVGEGYDRRFDPGYGEIPVKHGQNRGQLRRVLQRRRSDQSGDSRLG